MRSWLSGPFMTLLSSFITMCLSLLTWTCLKDTGQFLCRLCLNSSLSDVASWLGCALLEGDHRSDVCHAQAILSRGIFLPFLVALVLTTLVKVMSVRFSTLKLLISMLTLPCIGGSVLWSYVTMLFFIQLLPPVLTLVKALPWINYAPWRMKENEKPVTKLGSPGPSPEGPAWGRVMGESQRKRDEANMRACGFYNKNINIS